MQTEIKSHEQELHEEALEAFVKKTMARIRKGQLKIVQYEVEHHKNNINAATPHGFTKAETVQSLKAAISNVEYELKNPAK